MILASYGNVVHFIYCSATGTSVLEMKVLLTSLLLYLCMSSIISVTIQEDQQVIGIIIMIVENITVY